MPDIQTPEQVVAAIGELSGQMTDVQAQLRGVLAQGGGTMAAPMSGGSAAFTAKDGSIQLCRAEVRTAIEHEGETYIIEGQRPGLLDAESAGMLSADEAAAAKRYRLALEAVNACATVGLRRLPADQIAQLIQAGDSAPPSIRTGLAAHARHVAGEYSAMAARGVWMLSPSRPRAKRRDGALATSTAGGSGVAGQGWIADEYLPDAVDSTSRAYGLSDLLLSQMGGPGLHDTAAVKIRVLKRGGGMAILGRQTSNTLSGYPKTNLATETLSLTSARAVHASAIDGADLRDPRAVIDFLAMHRAAGMTARRATSDGILLHGSKSAGAASHLYGSAGLAKIVSDYRSVVADDGFAGTDLDPMLLADGMIAMATDASATVDLATTLGVSASAVLGTQANFLAAHTAMMRQISEQYRPGVAVVTSWSAAMKILLLGVGVNGEPAVRPATDAQKAANPWLMGTIVGGVPLMWHPDVTDYWTTGSAIVTSSGTGSALYYVAASTILDIRGADDERVTVTQAVDGDYTLVATMHQRAPFLAVDSGRKSVAVGYNLSV